MSEPIFLERLKSRGVLIVDGAMGTMLQTAGRRGDECGEAWNILHPDKVRAIHEAYLRAGSDAVLTNSFGGTRFRLREYGQENNVRELNRAAARVARDAAAAFGALVIGDIGPSGQLMEPYGEVSEEEMAEAFQEQAIGLIEGGVHALIVETMTSMSEMIVALRAAAHVAGNIPLIASYSIQKNGDQFRTMMGETVVQCVEAATSAGAHIVGCNCGLGIEEMIELVAEMRAVTHRPIIAQPNAGLPEVIAGKITYRQTPQSMAAKVPELIRAGASIIGGCCGTNPEFISCVKEIVSHEEH